MLKAKWQRLVLAFLCAASCRQALAADQSVHSKAPRLVSSPKTNFTPSVKSIHLSEAFQKTIGVICENDSNLPDNHQKIVYVSPDSPGSEAGLNDGDEVVSGKLLLNDLSLTLRRHGLPLTVSVKLTEAARKSFDTHPFELQLVQSGVAGNTSAGSSTRLSRQKPQFARDNVINGAAKTERLFDATAFQSDRLPVLDVNQKGEKVPVLDVSDPARVLAKFQMELIVDQSMSMTRNNDCPGGYSRWNWCGVQATELARAVAPFEAGGLTITTFNNLFQVHRHAAAHDLVRLFGNPNFHFGTRLAEPLHDRLSEYFATRNDQSKPLLIAVITDGVPVPKQIEPGMVIQELVRASGQMRNATEVTVVFFQVGGQARFGHNFLQYLDQNLYREGAHYHLVHTVPFESLVQNGLAKSLAQSVQAYGRNN